jgi:uroporphyrin-3 C-methyltransferase
VELNAPFLLPVRQLIHEDINALEAMPQLATDYIVLTLMALSKKTPELPLKHDNFAKNQDVAEDLRLSDNIDDWETNLSKSWKKFFNDFIRVRQRTGSVEPLMSPNEQLNLKNNLGLKVQLAIWAASQRKTDVYKQSLNNVELWLNEYFDMNATVNKKFVNDIIQLQQKMVNYDYPTDLSSLNAIRKVLKERTLVTKPVTNNTEQTKPTEKQLETTLEQEGKTTKAGEL